MEHHPESPVSPQKRRRRPSVRLGEIGFPAPYHASALLVEPPKRRKQAAVDTSSSVEVVSTGRGSGAKPPRTRPLEHVAADKKLVEEEWSVIEPAVALPDEQKLAADTVLASTSGREQQVKPRTRKVNNKIRSRASHGGGVNGGLAHATGKSKVNEEEEAVRPDSAAAADVPDSPKEEEEEGDRALQVDDDAPSLAKTSSDSQELFGSGSKGEEELPADDSRDVVNSAEEGDANPNSLGDEMQGAIEDGPGQANGKGSALLKPDEGNRNLGRQAECRDMVGEPSGRLQAAAAGANGTTVAPTFSQRVTLSSGVRGWLHALGLGKYSEMFELNEVDNEVLPLLTMDDLREMGVGAVGARRKMFSAIQELGQICGI